MKIHLLGPPQILTANGAAPTFVTAKAEGLFYYLIAENKTHTRAALAHLFWRDMSESKARVSLSKALSNLREQLGDYLSISTQAVAFRHDRPYWLDVKEFLQNVDAQHIASSPQLLLESVRLYRGDFLEGFHVRNAPEFERWMLSVRDRFRGIVVQTLSALATTYQAQNDNEKAIHAWRRLLSIERWHEEVHYQLMNLLVLTGEPLAALKQYESCREALAEELDVAPGIATTRLYERIRTNDLPAGLRDYPAGPIRIHAQSSDSGDAADRHGKLPQHPTEFVGRDQEVELILAHVRDPTCRLLTLVGPGGIGKTRLALEAAHRLTRSASNCLFPDGVFFVALIPVDTLAGVIAALADALGLAFYNNASQQQQLVDYLEHRKLLLILDNFEHLIKHAQFLAELLTTTAHLKILVTTRQAMPLRWAYYHPVRGLSYPAADGSDQEPAEMDAVLFFEKLAQRQDPFFDGNHCRESIIRICQLVDGIPLALEMAAAWLKMLSCSQIAQELEKSPELLKTDMADVPDRHRSMRTVFEQTWRILTVAEQAVLQKLTVFRGGFSAAAAEQVANASLQDLASLAEKVLIQPFQSGRCQLHELLRQFALEKLSIDQKNAVATYAAHSNYYLHMVIKQDRAFARDMRREGLFSLWADLDNIRTAWIWAAQNHQYAHLADALDNLYNFYLSACRYSEAQELFAASVRILHAAQGDDQPFATPGLANRLLVRRIMFDYLLGQQQQTKQSLLAILETVRAAADHRECAMILAVLGQMASWQDRQSDAATYLRESLTLYRAINDRLSSAQVHYMLAEMYTHGGHFQEGAAHALSCVEIGSQFGHNELLGNGLTTLGFAYYCLGRYAESLESYRKGRRCFEKSEDRLGYALATGGVGHALWLLEPDNWMQSTALVQLSLAICREIGHRLHTATRLFMLGQMYIRDGGYEQSLAYTEECVRLAEEAGYPLVVIGGLWVMSECYYALNDLASSHNRIRQALHLSLQTGIDHHLSHLAICYAKVLEQEANQLDPIAATANRIRAVRLATSALLYPTWYLSGQTAETLLERQKATLPEEQFSAGQTQAKRQTLKTIMSELRTGAQPSARQDHFTTKNHHRQPANVL